MAAYQRPSKADLDAFEAQAGMQHDISSERAKVDAGKARLQRWSIEAS
jgi:hypothetical protein